MIGIFLGEQNSGKTLSMTYYLKKYFDNGYTIYTNYNVNFKHKKITKELLEKYTKSKKQFVNCVFGIDEIYLFFDSRNFGTKSNKLFSYFVVQSSKRGVHILGTAQFFNTIELRFRNNTNFQVLCDRVLKYNNTIKPIKSMIRFLPKEYNENLHIRNILIHKTYDNNFNLVLKSKTLYLKANKLFDIYDTTQLLGID